MPITIEPFTADRGDAVYRLARAAWEFDVADIPFATPATFATALAGQWPATARERYVALLDGEVAGYLGLKLPLADNLDKVDLEVLTDPRWRRRGVGREMMRFARERARALGRTYFTGSTVDQRPGGGEVAVAMGAKIGLAETRSRLDVPPPDQERLDALLAEAWQHAQGYRLVQWTGVAPEEYLADAAYLESRYNLDAPTGELTTEPEKYDAERARANDAHRVAIGRTPIQTGAVHAGSGRMVGWTVIAGNDDTPTQAWQSLTLVDPEHRGHRLGLIVKLENLRHVRRLRPELTGIDTINASENERMLAINEAIGFRPVDSWIEWELTL